MFSIEISRYLILFLMLTISMPSRSQSIEVLDKPASILGVTLGVDKLIKKRYGGFCLVDGFQSESGLCKSDTLRPASVQMVYQGKNIKFDEVRALNLPDEGKSTLFSGYFIIEGQNYKGTFYNQKLIEIGLGDGISSYFEVEKIDPSKLAISFDEKYSRRENVVVSDAVKWGSFVRQTYMRWIDPSKSFEIEIVKTEHVVVDKKICLASLTRLKEWPGSYIEWKSICHGLNKPNYSLRYLHPTLYAEAFSKATELHSGLISNEEDRKKDRLNKL